MIKQLQTELLACLPGISAQKKMMPSFRDSLPKMKANVRKGAVTILLFPIEGKWNTLFIERSVDGQTHSGQIAFPGGKQDVNDYSFIYTAQRECFEEIGIPIEEMHILGQLSPLYIPPSNFLVHPILVSLKKLPKLNLQAAEVARTINAPLDELFNDSIKEEQKVRTSHDPNLKTKVPTYNWDEKTIIWGATAMMLSELEAIYKLL